MSDEQQPSPKNVPAKASYRIKRLACKTLGVPPPTKRKKLPCMTAGGKANFKKPNVQLMLVRQSVNSSEPIGSVNNHQEEESGIASEPVASSAIIPPGDEDEDEIQVVRVVPGSRLKEESKPKEEDVIL